MSPIVQVVEFSARLFGAAGVSTPPGTQWPAPNAGVQVLDVVELHVGSGPTLVRVLGIGVELGRLAESQQQWDSSIISRARRMVIASVAPCM